MDINAIFEKLNQLITDSGLTEENFTGGSLEELLDVLNTALANADEDGKLAFGIAGVIIGNLLTALLLSDGGGFAILPEGFKALEG